MQKIEKMKEQTLKELLRSALMPYDKNYYSEVTLTGR